MITVLYNIYSILYTIYIILYLSTVSVSMFSKYFIYNTCLYFRNEIVSMVNII